MAGRNESAQTRGARRSRPSPIRRRPSTRRLVALLTALSLAASVALWGALSLQMAKGRDPALAGKVKAAAATTPATRSIAPAPVQAPAPVVTTTS
jgi:hypothetical protein